MKWNAVYYFRVPANVGCFFFSFSLPPSADYAYVNILSTNGKQDRPILFQLKSSPPFSLFLFV